MIVCLCHGVRERELDAVIAAGASTVEEVGAECGAGTGCGTCAGEIEERLARCSRPAPVALASVPIRVASRDHD